MSGWQEGLSQPWQECLELLRREGNSQRQQVSKVMARLGYGREEGGQFPNRYQDFSPKEASVGSFQNLS